MVEESEIRDSNDGCDEFEDVCGTDLFMCNLTTKIYISICLHF